MNEKIAHQIEKMKKQTIGVEVEMNKTCSRFLWNRKIRKYSKQKWLHDLVSMG